MTKQTIPVLEKILNGLDLLKQLELVASVHDEYRRIEASPEYAAMRKYFSSSIELMTLEGEFSLALQNPNNPKRILNSYSAFALEFNLSLQNMKEETEPLGIESPKIKRIN